MKVTGHKNYKTFIEVYVNIDEETANEIREKVDAALAPEIRGQSLAVGASEVLN